MKRPNLTVILNCGYCLVINYLVKGFYIIERESKQTFMLPNDVKLIINVIDQLDTDFFHGKKNQFHPYQTPSNIAYSEKYTFDLQTGLI